MPPFFGATAARELRREMPDWRFPVEGSWQAALSLLMRLRVGRGRDQPQHFDTQGGTCCGGVQPGADTGVLCLGSLAPAWLSQ